MRRLIPAVLLLLVVTIGGCKRKRHRQSVEEPGPATVLNTADPRVAGQLLRGFYSVEANAWRWTKGDFAAALKPPAGAAQKGATLIFRFVIPPTSIEQLKSVKLSASVNGTPLPA